MKNKPKLKIALLWAAIIAFIVFLFFFWSLIQNLMEKSMETISEETAIAIAHEAVASKLSEEKLDYDILEDQSELNVDGASVYAIFCEVTVHTGDKETNERMKSFCVEVDVYEGTVIQVREVQ